ncbi:MAG: class I SAM-dependent methyltransferase [Spirochaetales bacterium]|nr:class I SAM-dependent methyltransferase [Leptospiraceae bacterium]MCP5483391.1 class I SAM-dependent methyltransferase [Spirochaetales bacterium]
MRAHLSAERGFDRLAPLYDLGTLPLASYLRMARSELLKHIPAPRSVLAIGDGSGRGVADLLARGKPERVCLVDISEAMLERAHRRCAAIETGAKIEYVHADIRELKFDGSFAFDLVLTHFLLDCFENSQVRAIVERVSRVCTPNALWYASDFSQCRGLAALPADAIVRMLYGFFRVTCGIDADQLPDYGTCFEKSGWHELQRQEYLQGWIFGALYARLPLRGETPS